MRLKNKGGPAIFEPSVLLPPGGHARNVSYDLPALVGCWALILLPAPPLPKAGKWGQTGRRREPLRSTWNRHCGQGAVSNLYLTKQELPARWVRRYEYLPFPPPFVRSYAHPRLADSTVKMKTMLWETALGALVFHSGPLPGFTYVLVLRGAGRNHD